MIELNKLELERQMLIQKDEEKDGLLKDLKKSDAMYKALVKACTDAVSVTDLKADFIEVSQRTLELHGYNNPEDLISKSAFILIDPISHETAKKYMQETVERGCVKNIILTLLRKDGSRFIGELNTAVVYDENNEPAALLAITRNIDRYVKIQEELNKINGKDK
jgi:PAS domain S-box-containing protein